MNDDHVFKGDDGVEWVRIFDIPGAVIDSIFSMNPHDGKEFTRKTGQRRGKIGDLLQLSAELSEKRKNKDGRDFTKEKAMDNYESSRVRGTVHPDRKKEMLKQAIGKSKHFEFEP